MRALKDSFRRELKTAHTEITRLRVELDTTNHKQLDANNKVSRQRDELEDVKDDVDHTIARLRDQVVDLELLNIEPLNLPTLHAVANYHATVLAPVAPLHHPAPVIR